MEPTTCGLIALAVLALLCGMRRRRTGVGEANRKGAKDAERDAEKTRTAQEAMAERKLLWGIEKWREGK